jgi:hypothetical protein
MKQGEHDDAAAAEPTGGRKLLERHMFEQRVEIERLRRLEASVLAMVDARGMPVSEYPGDPMEPLIAAIAESLAAKAKPFVETIDEVRGKLDEAGVAVKPSEWVRPNVCNRHSDCAGANAKAATDGRPRPDHCYSDECEECFGQ